MMGSIYCLNHGCDRIYFTPFKEPILWLGLLANKPLMRLFTSLVTTGTLGNLGSE